MMPLSSCAGLIMTANNRVRRWLVIIALLLIASSCAATPCSAGDISVAAYNISSGLELVMVQGSVKTSKPLPDVSLSPACNELRCQASLQVLYPSTNSNQIVVLVPTAGSVTMATISLDSMIVAGDYTISLSSCDPVLITAAQPNATLVHVVCVKQGAVHLYRVTINATLLSLSSVTESLIQHTITNLSCLSNMVTTHTPQGTLIVFSDCTRIVILRLLEQSFYPHEPNTCSGGNIHHIVALNGHPDTILVYCNATYPIYYNIDNEGPSNITNAPPIKIPTPCADPLAMVKAIPSAGNIEYRSYTSGCTDQLSVSNNRLLSWQCLGNHVDLIVPYSTHAGLYAAIINLTNPCAPLSNITMIQAIDCSNEQCRPLYTIGDQYLVFQSSNDIVIYCLAPVIQPLATISNIADSLVLLTVVHYPTAAVSSSPSTIPSTIAPPTTLTITPSPTMMPSSPILLEAILVPIILVLAIFVAITIIVITTILIIYYHRKYRRKRQSKDRPNYSIPEQGPSTPAAPCPAPQQASSNGCVEVTLAKPVQETARDTHGSGSSWKQDNEPSIQETLNI